MSGQAADKARAAWGEAMPDWVAALADAADATSQAQVADRLGYSAAVVSCVLRDRYAGDLASVRQAVEGALMRASVDCPVLGELRADRCLAEQRKPLSASSPQRVRLWRACRSCQHARAQRQETSDDR